MAQEKRRITWADMQKVVDAYNEKHGPDEKGLIYEAYSAYGAYKVVKADKPGGRHFHTDTKPGMSGLQRTPRLALEAVGIAWAGYLEERQ